MKRARLYVIIALIGLIADQVIKYFAQKTPQFVNGVFVFKGSFGLKLFLNERFAWGLPASNGLTLAFMLMALALLLWMLARSRQRMRLAPLLLVMAGAVSNIFDRIAYGGVVDYIVVPWGGIVNVADAMIFVGMMLLLCERILFRKQLTIDL